MADVETPVTTLRFLKNVMLNSFQHLSCGKTGLCGEIEREANCAQQFMNRRASEGWCPSRLTD